MANEVDVAMDPLYIAVTAVQMDNLLGTTEVTSSGLQHGQDAGQR